MKNTGLLIVALLLAAGAAVGLFGARSFLKGTPAPGLSSAPAEPPAALPPGMPALEESDGLARGRAQTLSSEPAFREWLKLESLIPRLVAAMNMIADGRFPRESFAAFAPRGKFLVEKKGEEVFVDPVSYARYDGFAAMVGRVDAVAAAKIFEELLPLFDAAQRALGERKGGAREAFFGAVRELLRAPALAGTPALKAGKKGIGWVYADDSLESRSPAQKQLMRMGPRNQAVVQAKLRAVSLALGGPAAP